MGTTGKAAWEKYFKDNGDVDTFVKDAADTYDLISQTKVTGNLPKGQKITYLSADAYDSKPVIDYEAAGKKYTARIKFDMMQKPGIRSTTDPTNVKTIANKSLSPDGLGLGGKTIIKREYIKTANTAIDAFFKLHAILIACLKCCQRVMFAFCKCSLHSLLYI